MEYANDLYYTLQMWVKSTTARINNTATQLSSRRCSKFKKLWKGVPVRGEAEKRQWRRQDTGSRCHKRRGPRVRPEGGENPKPITNEVVSGKKAVLSSQKFLTVFFHGNNSLCANVLPGYKTHPSVTSTLKLRPPWIHHRVDVLSVGPPFPQFCL